MLAVACALVLAERQASAQQVCAQVSKPYVSGGAALAPAPGFGPGTLGGPQGGTVQLRITNLGIAVGQQVLVGPLNVASPEIVKVLAAAPAGPVPDHRREPGHRRGRRVVLPGRGLRDGRHAGGDGQGQGGGAGVE